MIWAACVFHGCQLDYLPVLNPGKCDGRTWLVEYVGDVPIWLVVEAESASDAQVALNDDPEWGFVTHVAIPEGDDEPTGVPGVQFVRVHGDENSDPPFPVRYHDDGYHEQGIDPRQFARAGWN